MEFNSMEGIQHCYSQSHLFLNMVSLITPSAGKQNAWKLWDAEAYLCAYYRIQ